MSWKLCALTLFVDVVKNLFDNRGAENYKEFKEKLLKSIQDICANMSIKVQFLHRYIDKFPAMRVMSKKNDSIRISKQWKSATRDGGVNE